MIETLGWHKDQWLDIDRIFIAANNRGLKFADGIFETILIKENKPILFDEHLKRLEKSSKILNINLKINKLTLRQLIHDGIKKLSLKNDQFASVRINYSRGINEGRTLTINSTSDHFLNYLIDAFNTLYEEGDTNPKMMSIGLHCRLIGRPGRFQSLKKFIQHISSYNDIWIAKRVDIARFWIKNFPFKEENSNDK